jgi:Cu/Ag efflux protein CusF
VKNASRLLVIAYTFLLVVSGMAAEKKAGSDKDSKLFDCALDAGKSCIRGEVTVVDSKTGRFTVATKDKQMSFGVDSKAKPALGKTKVGDIVEVAYTETNGKLTATSISPIQAPVEKK